MPLLGGDAMILVVDPEGLLALARDWDQTAQAVADHRSDVASVGAGAQNFGRINQYMTPALVGFVMAASRVAQECGDQWQEGALAARDTANDLHLVDAGVARALGGGQ